VIPYRGRRGTLELLAVFHGRQRWPGRGESQHGSQEEGTAKEQEHGWGDLLNVGEDSRAGDQGGEDQPCGEEQEEFGSGQDRELS